MTKKFSHAVIYNGVFYPANTPIEEPEEVKEPEQEPEEVKEPEQGKPKGRPKK